MLRYADPTQCALGVLLPLFSRADRAHTRLSPLALCQGAPHSEACHHLRCAGVQEPGRRKALFPEADEAIIVPPTHTPMHTHIRPHAAMTAASAFDGISC